MAATGHTLFQGGSKSRHMRAYLAAYELLAQLEKSHAGRRVRLLDIGGAHGLHARLFRSHNIECDIVDLVGGEEKALFIGDYFDFTPSAPYDVVWSSHMLEHTRNPGLLLDKMRTELAPDGYCAVTVPPLRGNRMAYDHYSFWNCGMLWLHMCLAGFDAQTARLGQYAYNVSAIARARNGPPPNPREGLAQAPDASKSHFSGDFRFWNWTYRSPDMLPIIDVSESDADDRRVHLMQQANARFCRFRTDGKMQLCYLDGDGLVKCA